METPNPLLICERYSLSPKELEQWFAAVFDADWYLATYPDVAAAEVEPWQHFITHGFGENRLPCAVPALLLEPLLWQLPAQSPTAPQRKLVPVAGDVENDDNKLHSILKQLQDEWVLTSDDGIQSLRRVCAGWVLARWYGSFGPEYVPEVIDYTAWLQDDELLTLARFAALMRHPGAWLLRFSALWQCSRQAQGTTNTLVARLLECPTWRQFHAPTGNFYQSVFQQDYQLAVSLFSRQLPDAAMPRGTTLSFNEVSQPTTLFDRLHAQVTRPIFGRLLPQRLRELCHRRQLVSVIIPCFNAEATIATALRSLSAQTWPALEIIVVDDASSDGTVAIVQQWQQHDRRIRLFRQPHNRGAYAARNRGLQHSRGAYFTTHDADDWSHPEKIERQVKALQGNSDAMASVSHWVRASEDLTYGRWRGEATWIYRNVSSLLCRRQVLNEMGYWDLVSCNADTEYYYRLQAVYGEAAIVEVDPGVVLAIGRQSADSLTQHSETHLRSQFYGLRKDYMESAWAWHRSGERLYLSADPEQSRPFPVPASMCRNRPEICLPLQIAELAQNPWFDEGWYCSQYPDVVASGMDGATHFLLHGHSEGRNPGPLYCREAELVAAQLASNVHYCIHQQLAPTELIVVGHLVSAQQFGAERSLLDMLAMLSDRWHVTVALPNASSPDYVNAVAARCQQVVIFPFQWWHAQQRLSHTLVRQGVAAFHQLYQQVKPKLVYVNTLTLWQPLLAAQARGLANVMHVRELPANDRALCELLGASAEEIAEHIRTTADRFIANSNAVATYLAAPERTTIIPNVIAPHWFNIPLSNLQRKRQQGKPQRVGMLSSNLAKKGIADFVALARELAADDIECWLVGPHSDDLQQCFQQWQLHSELPNNLKVTGYVQRTQAIMAELDLVVNLSHFAESFGRSLLEAMAAGRPVVCYSHGALIDLVNDDVGKRVALGDYRAVAAGIRQCLQAESYPLYARAARQHASQYRAEQIAEKVNELITRLTSR